MKEEKNGLDNNMNESNRTNNHQPQKENYDNRISREQRARLAAKAREQRYKQVKNNNEQDCMQESSNVPNKNNKQSKKTKVIKSLVLVLFVVVVGGCSILYGVLSQKDKNKAVQVDADVKVPKTVSENKDNTTKKSEETTKQEQTTKSSETKKDDKTFKDPKIIEIDKDKWYLTCVNRDYGVKSTYKPKLTKLTISSNDPRQTEKAKSQSMDYRAAEQYQKMYDAAAKEGVYLTPYSGYRSIQFQKDIFDNHVRINREKGYSLNAAKFKASEIVLPPGTSEHNLGLAIDIVSTNENFENSKEYRWLDKHAQDHGFILRYQKNKTDVTNISYEPWHWRYVGVKDAQKIKSQGCCLEEYLNIK